MEKWEYKAIQVSPYDSYLPIEAEEQLNIHAEQGWELVAAAGIHGNTLIFKRQKEVQPYDHR